MDFFSTLGRKALFTLGAETAHGFSIKGLKSGLLPVCGPALDPRLAVNVAGLHFANPLGLAAGYDKNAEVPAEVLKLGFGFTEAGTLTPKPQAGNPKPRLFRLTRDMAVINRMGFNNEGHAAALVRLKKLDPKLMVGVNIGANKDSEDRVADYVAGIRTFYGVARYFTANISSPNTPGLRNLQDRESLDVLLAAVLGARDEETAKAGKHIPVFLKIAPDMTEGGLDDIAEVALARKLDGLIVSNTTLKRDGLSDARLAGEAGGLSGKPLFELSTTVLAKMRQRVGKDMPIIGAGGVYDAQTAAEKIRAGADLVQLYSCMVYEGPGLPGKILRGLSALADREGYSSISEIRDSHVADWAQRNI